MADFLKQALLKAASFCAYQERTVREVRQKLSDWQITDHEADQIIEELIAQKYLNEERFARIFAGSKFRQKHWGRLKIRQELKIRGVTNELIQKGLSEIEDDAYYQTLCQIIEKKKRELKTDAPINRQQKLLRFALSKGYESDLIWEIIKKTTF
jgi:regulatory protein